MYGLCIKQLESQNKVFMERQVENQSVANELAINGLELLQVMRFILSAAEL